MTRKQRTNPPGWWLPLLLALPAAGAIMLVWCWKGPLLMELIEVALKLVVIP